MRRYLKKLSFIVFAAALSVAGVASTGKSAAKKYTFKGVFLEGCSCSAPCPCELTGVKMGCETIQFFEAEKGSKFDGADLSGAKYACAFEIADWIVIYVDAPTAEKRKAMEAFARARLGNSKKIGTVKSVRISLASHDGIFTASIDDGRICDFKSKMVTGLDKKKPLVYSNINDPMHPTMMQAKTISVKYSDGAHEFDLKDSNSYFNLALNSSGTI